MPSLPPMLLAVDAGAIVAVVFGLISFIGWVMNQVNGMQKQAPPAPRKRAPRDRTVQEEIDQFLSDRDRKGRPESRAERRRDDDVLTADQVELIDEPPRKPAPAPAPAPAPVQQKPRPKGKPTPQKKTPPRPQPQRMARPLTESSTTTTTHPGAHAAQLGKSFQETVDKTMAPRVLASVGKALPRSVDQSVAKHLGRFSGSSEQLPPSPRETADIVDALRNPKSVRTAIIVNEILSRPLSQRKK